MINIFLALLVVIAIMLTYRLGVVAPLLNPDSTLRRAIRRRRHTMAVRREVADLDREYASLVDEYRHIP